jgi:glutamate--cysteine ligase
MATSHPPAHPPHSYRAPHPNHAPGPRLTRAVIESHVRDHVFGTASITDTTDAIARHSVGIELEWLTGYRGPQHRLSADQAAAVVADLSPLPKGSRVTIEPGGQLELSSARFDSLDEALAGTATDLFVLDHACDLRRIELIALGADPLRPPERVLDAQRYEAMEAFFETDGRAGKTMMCNTASVQVNVGLGDEQDTADRWRLANALGPTLSACFANSPFSDGRPSGWVSTRLRAWWQLDPSRAMPPRLARDPVECWTAYALDARVMLIRRGDGCWHPITERLTFAQWMAEGHELGWPTLDDFTYHLTTLFPPVRPRGWFEIRYIDALPTPFWHVAAAVISTVLDDAEARGRVWAAIDGTADLWIDAAQLGLAHPRLGRAGRDVFEIALDTLGRTCPDSATTDVVAGYFDRWVARGRSPADDRLDAWRRDGTSLSERHSPVPYGRELVAEPGRR